MREGCSPDSVIVTSGTKKNAIATPCTTVGIMMVVKSACVVNSARIPSTTANTTKAKLAYRRGSNRLTVSPTMGESTMASNPTGASTMPACVAV